MATPAPMASTRRRREGDGGAGDGSASGFMRFLLGGLVEGNTPEPGSKFGRDLRTQRRSGGEGWAGLLLIAGKTGTGCTVLTTPFVGATPLFRVGLPGSRPSRPYASSAQPEGMAMDEYRCPIHGIVEVSIGETVRFGCPKCGGRIQLTQNTRPPEVTASARDRDRARDPIAAYSRSPSRRTAGRDARGRNRPQHRRQARLRARPVGWTRRRRSLRRVVLGLHRHRDLDRRPQPALGRWRRSPPPVTSGPGATRAHDSRTSRLDHRHQPTDPRWWEQG